MRPDESKPGGIDIRREETSFLDTVAAALNLKAHSDIVRLADNPRVVVAKDAPHAGKVGVVTGGGSGHEPAFVGYTGRNMLDAVAVGELFSSPTAKSFHDAIREANGGRGVICLYGNYAGDNMNVKMAIKLAAKDGIEVATVVANDDVCSAPPEEREKRRGVAGEIFMWKVGGALLQQLGQVQKVGQHPLAITAGHQRLGQQVVSTGWTSTDVRPYCLPAQQPGGFQ